MLEKEEKPHYFDALTQVPSVRLTLGHCQALALRLHRDMIPHQILKRVRAPSHNSGFFFLIPIIVGTADGLPQNLGHSSRGTWYRSVAPLVGSSRQEVPVMRALFDRVATSLKTVQMRIGTRQDVFRHATDTCPCSRGLVPSVWAQLACSNR